MMRTARLLCAIGLLFAATAGARPLAAAGAPSHTPVPLSMPRATTATPAIQAQVLLSGELARHAGIAQLAPALALAPGRFALVADSVHMYLVGWGGVRPLDGDPLSAFAYTGDGMLMGVRGRQFMYLAADGHLKTVAGLPDDNMGIAAGPDRVLLFERRASGNSTLYEFLPGRRMRRLLDSPLPIAAAASAGQAVYFAAGNAVFVARPGASLQVAAALPGTQMILSVAVPATGNRLYVSSATDTFVVADGKATLLLKGIGGALLADGNALLVLDTRTSTLVRLADITP